LALRSRRFSLIDLPDFFDNECRGDLSAIDCSLIGNLCGSVLGRYALHGDRVRLSGVVVVGSAAAAVDPGGRPLRCARGVGRAGDVSPSEPNDSAPVPSQGR
jgi:hypothetical protein